MSAAQKMQGEKQVKAIRDIVVHVKTLQDTSSDLSEKLGLKQADRDLNIGGIGSRIKASLNVDQNAGIFGTMKQAFEPARMFKDTTFMGFGKEKFARINQARENKAAATLETATTALSDTFGMIGVGDEPKAPIVETTKASKDVPKNVPKDRTSKRTIDKEKSTPKIKKGVEDRKALDSKVDEKPKTDISKPSKPTEKTTPKIETSTDDQREFSSGIVDEPKTTLGETTKSTKEKTKPIVKVDKNDPRRFDNGLDEPTEAGKQTVLLEDILAELKKIGEDGLGSGGGMLSGAALGALAATFGGALLRFLGSRAFIGMVTAAVVGKVAAMAINKAGENLSADARNRVNGDTLALSYRDTLSEDDKQLYDRFADGADPNNRAGGAAYPAKIQRMFEVQDIFNAMTPEQQQAYRLGEAVTYEETVDGKVISNTPVTSIKPTATVTPITDNIDDAVDSSRPEVNATANPIGSPTAAAVSNSSDVRNEINTVVNNITNNTQAQGGGNDGPIFSIAPDGTRNTDNVLQRHNDLRFVG